MGFSKSEIIKAFGQDLGNGAGNVKEARALANELAADLRQMISGSDMPGGVKSALINSVSVSMVNLYGAVISVSAIRPSIFASIGLYGSVDLAVIYDKKSALKKSAVYYNKETHERIPIGLIQGFARAYNTNYLERTASAFMAKHPDCTVTVSK